MPTGYVRLATEATPGNEVANPALSTKKLFLPLQEFTPKLGPSHLSRDDELRNQDEPLAVIPDAYTPEIELKMRLYPDLAGMLLKTMLGNPVTTAGNGVITDPDGVAIPAGAYRHVWAAPFGPAGAAPITGRYDIAYRDQAAYFESKGTAHAECDIESPEEGGTTIGVSGPSLYLGGIADPALTPAYESLAVRPFMRSNLTLPTWLTGTGVTEDVSLKISNPVEASRSLGIASKWPDVMEKANEGPIVVSGSISKRQLDTDDINALMAATGFPAVARWISDSIITGAYKYGLWCSMSNAQYMAGDPDPLGNKRRHGAKFEFKSTTASTGSTTFTLVNATASYN
jgi:hypothetical protein